MKVSSALVLLFVNDPPQFPGLVGAGAQDQTHSLHRGLGLNPAKVDGGAMARGGLLLTT